ncbi:uncharacterized protein J7T54_005753 [Emericellopsis cladophorae]|uniref:Uncharacterized protein n=1 Tax=Emericellopsis cladophorae TaxID=2686198 RepID=A0A9P9XY43_9HYPO|nr:uncharacterized protein J7T54_005753 [Emericellopsis cladophorae]KAI6779723.1 hypothetical protein J7T54_005753 [Emericellopsis cladophorae]
MTRAQLFDNQQASHDPEDNSPVFDSPPNAQYATHKECYANNLGYAWRYSDKHSHGAEAHWHDHRHDGSYRLEGRHIQQGDHLYSEENEYTHRAARGAALDPSTGEKPMVLPDGHLNYPAKHRFLFLR